MRRLACLGIAALAAGCNDIREFRGAWSGPRVGEGTALRQGLEEVAGATLHIDSVDRHGLSGRLADAGALDGALAPIAGAEADALAHLTFEGAPLRVYLAFAAVGDGAGDATAVISLYDDDRVELRVLRGPSGPLYGIFALRRAP